ncbi:RlpA-like double-psi beta-barrel domain-containing protein [Amycolatopsis sp. NPDC059657]|uniref:RlpA-like double-psi beta-barrel domain-containing protein n=1 Tax=Amycolatopsis sp. NPDC059657 TaxID=3346899 RepID=UPI0036710465
MGTIRFAALVAAALLACAAPAASAAGHPAHATFYTGDEGGACGFGNWQATHPGELSTAVSKVLFKDGASCGTLLKVQCVTSSSCLPGSPVITVRVTNFCPPNPSLPSDNGGWCNPPREHLDLSEKAFLKIAQRKAGIVPITYSEADADGHSPLRFTIKGNPDFNQVLVDSNSRWSTQAVWIKGSKTEWLPMSRDWGMNWASGKVLTGQALSFKVVDTHGRTVIRDNVFPAGWKFGQTATAAGF